MTTEDQDPHWEKLSKAFFGAPRTDDEGFFTSRVMRNIRALEPTMNDRAWHYFLRWAIPVLGVGVASLVLATRTPAFYTEDPVTLSGTVDDAQ